VFWKRSDKKEKNLKNLSEKEIQKQLYGDYLGKGEYRLEVMDSAAIVESKDEKPIEEKFDSKLKKEVDAELKGLQSEFRHLKDEVNRLKREKESLERTEFWFKPPFLKVKHLIVIGSVVVLLGVMVVSVFTVKFIIKGMREGKTSGVARVEPAATKIYTIRAYTTSKKEDAQNAMRLLSSKKVVPDLKETKSASGKSKYVVYAGEYVDKKEADRTVQRLRKEKQFRDCFVLVKPQ
jgi:hypothetical protein